MFYKLAPAIALRKWRSTYAYYLRGEAFAQPLKQEEFELLCKCDGNHSLEKSDLLCKFLARGMCWPCEQGDGITSWQKPKFCSNHYFPSVNWAITGKCNYNCLHCFMAADNARLMGEFTWEECLRLIDECEECGIQTFTLTGGEPMLHPRFMDILKEIHGRGMEVIELNTNGHFISEATLKQMKDIGCVPLMKISFDGLGHHDWLRNHDGAEKRALTAIKLCIKKGFPVKVQTNVHKKNVDCMLKTSEYLDALGVNAMRIIRTTEAPRWAENAGDSCLSITDYYDFMLDFTEAYIAKPHKMNIDIWQFLCIYPNQGKYLRRPLGDCDHYRDSFPVCRGNRSLVAITANGNVVPCNQMSGYYEKQHDILGNVKTDGLKQLLTESKYLDEVFRTIGELRQKSTKCSVCQYFEHCRGGCRAIALALTGDKMAADPAKCLFFEDGYLEKTDAVFQKNERTNGIVYRDINPYV